MRKSMILLLLVVAMVDGACSGEVTASAEYQSLELEVADLEQRLSDTEVELSEARAMLDRVPDEVATIPEVPADVMALLDEWWAANERADGSVVDLYTPSGYHLYGDRKVRREDLAAHLNSASDPEWITEPYLIVAEPDGRYVVTRGMRSGPWGSAVTFEVVTTPEGELKLAQTAWTKAH
jgi:hypothetical protein